MKFEYKKILEILESGGGGCWGACAAGGSGKALEHGEDARVIFQPLLIEGL
jgi:hypothetical protein